MNSVTLQNYAGSLYVFLAQGPAFILHTLAKALQSGAHGERSLPTLQIITIRMVLTLIPGLAYLYYKSVPNLILGGKDVRHLLVIRAIAGAIGVGGFYASMIYLPLVEATVISFLSPLLTTIASKTITKTKLAPRQIGASFLCFVGVVCVTLPRLRSQEHNDSSVDNPVSYPQPALGLLIALVGVLGSSVSADLLQLLLIQPSSFVSFRESTANLEKITILCVRRIGPRAHPLITMNYLAYMMLLISVVVSSLRLQSMEYTWNLQFEQWIMLLGVGLFAFIMEILQTYGFTLDASPRAVNMLYSQAILAFGSDILVWKTKFSPFSFIGVAAIVVGLIFMNHSPPASDVLSSGDTDDSSVSLQDVSRISGSDLDASQDVVKESNHSTI